MDQGINNVQERRTTSPELIEHMLAERNQLLSLLFAMSNKQPENGSLKSITEFEEFLQVLVDYIASGHFGLYQRIAEGNERRKTISDLAVEIYPRIEQTTEAALAFDEKYNADTDALELSHFHEDLSNLGEELTSRIELEDRLIDLMLSPKSESAYG